MFSWVFILNQLAGVAANDMLHQSKDRERRKLFQGRTPLVTTARNRYGRPSIGQLLEVSSREGAVTFLVGREPFQRLVSGFRDKFGKGPFRLRDSRTHDNLITFLKWVMSPQDKIPLPIPPLLILS